MVGLKTLWDEIKCSTLYGKRVILEKIFTGIGIVLFICSLFNFNLILLIEIVVGIVIGILILMKFLEEETIKRTLLKRQVACEVKEQLAKEKNSEIKLWVEGSKDMNQLVLTIVSLGVIMAKLNSNQRIKEKLVVIKEFVKEIENLYELKDETKIKAEEILKTDPNLYEVTKNLKELEISDFVENKISDFLWQIVLENGYLGIEEEKLLHSWNL